jgi:small subunit ribosomal protein S6
MSAQPMATPVSGYETTYIVRSDLSEEALKTLQAKLESIVKDFKGEVVLSEDWGRRKLAYPISKEAKGHYLYFVYSGKGDVVHEVERNLRLHDRVLRFLSVTLGDEFDPAEFTKTRTAAQEAAKRREEEREARREERMSYESSYSNYSSDEFEG